MAKSTKTLFHPYRLRLTGIYTLAIVESVLEMVYPLAIGLAINGLIEGKGMISAIPLILVWLCQAAFGGIYQLVASRLAARIYRDLADKLILQKNNSTVSDSMVVARVDMVEKVCDALIEVVPLLLRVVIGIVVSSIMLFTYNLLAGTIAVMLIVIIGLLQWWYTTYACELSERINTRRESQVSIIINRKLVSVTTHFKKITRLNVRFSDIATGTWAIADILSLVALLIMLFIIAGMEKYDAGSIFAMITYVLTLSNSLEQVPTMIEEGVYFNDVSSRVSQNITD